MTGTADGLVGPADHRGLLKPVAGPAVARRQALVPSPARAVAAMIRRDAAERQVAGLPFLFDFCFGGVNLLVFSFISRVLREPAHPLAGHPGTYFDFVAVGIAFMLVVQAAAAQISARLRDEQRTGTLEMLAAQPLGAATIAVGMSAYPMALAIVRAAAYLGVAGALLGLDVGSASWPGVALVLVLGAVAALGMGIALGAYTVAFEHGQTVCRLAVLAVGFLSGTYFPTSALPPAARWVSLFLPTRIALDGLRTALGGGDWVHAALVLAVSITIGLPAAITLFGLALRRAGRRGTLTRG